MLTLEEKKKRDKQICRESKSEALARLIGYDEIGQPIEIVFDTLDDMYEWHVGGERVRDASDEMVMELVP